MIWSFQYTRSTRICNLSILTNLILAIFYLLCFCGLTLAAWELMTVYAQYYVLSNASDRLYHCGHGSLCYWQQRCRECADRYYWCVTQAGAMLGDAFLHQLPHAFGNFSLNYHKILPNQDLTSFALGSGNTLVLFWCLFGGWCGKIVRSYIIKT